MRNLLSFQELPSSSSSESAASSSSSNGVNGDQQQQQSEPSNGDAATSASSPSEAPKPDLLGDLVANSSDSDRRVQEENERNLEASEKGAVDSEIKENNRYKNCFIHSTKNYPILLK